MLPIEPRPLPPAAVGADGWLDALGGGTYGWVEGLEVGASVASSLGGGLNWTVGAPPLAN